MATTLTLWQGENPGTEHDIDLFRLQHDIEFQVRELIAQIIKERMKSDTRPTVLQCDVHFDLNPMGWFGGKVEWDVDVIVGGVRADRVRETVSALSPWKTPCSNSARRGEHG